MGDVYGDVSSADFRFVGATRFSASGHGTTSDRATRLPQPVDGAPRKHETNDAFAQ